MPYITRYSMLKRMIFYKYDKIQEAEEEMIKYSIDLIITTESVLWKQKDKKVLF